MPQPKLFHYDMYAFRSKDFPLGPELIKDWFWNSLWEEDAFDLASDQWVPVYSAFGGLAIYKTSSLLPLSYSGAVTADLQRYYERIFSEMAPDNPQLSTYLRINGIKDVVDLGKIPVIFVENTNGEHPDYYHVPTCCEHVALHAAMAIHGHTKIYVNPKMILMAN